MVLNRSHHGASNANGEKINSVTPKKGVALSVSAKRLLA